MKYLRTLPIAAAEAINRQAWQRANPNLAQIQSDLHASNTHPNISGLDKPNVTEFLCHMAKDEAGDRAELHIPPEAEQHFTAAQRAQMNDVQEIVEVSE